MKPNFALTLSFDGIGLLHRSEGGWRTVGDVPLNDPDLAGALQALAASAETLEPGAVTTKLVVPNQQIRYLTFESESRDIDILEAQVRSTLNGATPYHVSELAYDWSMTGGEVCVAAVAIETLTEAESFAVDHGFSPLSFVAVPDEGAFQGEPFFGETVHAGEVLTPGDSVERDEDAIAVLGPVQLPEPEQEPEQEQESKTAPEPDPEPEPAPNTVTPMAGFQSARRAPPPSEDPAPTPEPAPEIKPPEPPVDQAPEQDAAPAVAFSSARRAAPRADTETTALPQGRFNPGGPIPDQETAAPDVAPAPIKDAEPAPSLAPPPVTAEPSKAPTAPPPPQPSLRTTPPERPKSEAPPAVAKALAKTLTQPPAPIRPAAKPAAPASKHPGRVPFLSSRKTDARAGAAPRPAGSDSGKKWGMDVRSGLSKARSAAAGLAGSASAFRAKPTPASAAEQSAVQAIEDERQRMTVFGARNPDNTSTESNPRYLALALTAGLLFFLVAVAAWAALFLEGGVSSLFRSSEDVQFAQDDPAAIEAPAALPTTEDGTVIAALPAEPETPARDTEDLADEPFATLQPDSAISDEPSPDEARARYAATGIWQMSPTASRAPLARQFQDIYQTSLDPAVNFSDAVALPDVALLLPSARPATPAPALPPGVDGVARDARGFVLATPEGTVSPDRLYTVFAGAPPLIPPPTPERAAPEPQTQPQAEVVEVALAAPDSATQEAGLRPRARPTDLSDGFERANNNGRTLDELQTLRPRLRPQSAQEQALVEAGISPEIDDTAETLFEDATEEAVTASLKPRLRPDNFARIVEETRETAASEPVSVEQRVTVAIPTTASVARAATENNQISLRRLNLIGVYGSAESRRALVRLPNGRYKKVQVGDRLDGGQVAAIGSDELRYIKSGQSVVLKMPRS